MAGNVAGVDHEHMRFYIDSDTGFIVHQRGRYSCPDVNTDREEDACSDYSDDCSVYSNEGRLERAIQSDDVDFEDADEELEVHDAFEMKELLDRLLDDESDDSAFDFDMELMLDKLASIADRRHERLHDDYGYGGGSAYRGGGGYGGNGGCGYGGGGGPVISSNYNHGGGGYYGGNSGYEYGGLSDFDYGDGRDDGSNFDYGSGRGYYGGDFDNGSRGGHYGGLSDFDYGSGRGYDSGLSDFDYGSGGGYYGDIADYDYGGNSGPSRYCPEDYCGQRYRGDRYSSGHQPRMYRPHYVPAYTPRSSPMPEAPAPDMGSWV